MKAMVCEICGSNEFVKQDGMFICQQCRTKYTVEEAKKLIVDVADSSEKSVDSVSEKNSDNGTKAETIDYENKKRRKKIITRASVIAGIVIVLVVGAFVGFKIFNDFRQTTIIKQSDNSALQNQANNSSNDEKNTSKPEITATPLVLGENIYLDYVEMTLYECEVSDGYNFEYTDDSSEIPITHKASIECPNGMKLVCLKGYFKNKTNGEIYPSNNPTNAVMTINGSEYQTKFKCFDSFFAESIMNVAAQRQVEYYLYAEVPENVANSITSCEIKFGFVKDLNPSAFVNSDSDFDHLYVLKLNHVPKTLK